MAETLAYGIGGALVGAVAGTACVHYCQKRWWKRFMERHGLED